MARPSLGDTPSVRLDMRITEGEIKAIDAWAARNLASSRSDAIRRLCAMAIRVSAPADALKAMEGGDG